MEIETIFPKEIWLEIFSLCETRIQLLLIMSKNWDEEVNFRIKKIKGYLPDIPYSFLKTPLFSQLEILNLNMIENNINKSNFSTSIEDYFDRKKCNISFLTNLKELHTKYLWSSQDFLDIGNLTKLETLKINCKVISNNLLTNLKKLTIMSFPGNNSGIITKFPNIKYLNYENLSIMNSIKLPKLKTLIFNGKINGFEFPKLKRVKINYSSGILENNFFEKMTNLKILNLNSLCRINQRLIDSLDNLVYLSLGVSASYECSEQFLSIKKMINLKILIIDVPSCHTLKIRIPINEIIESPTIEYVSATNNPQISIRGIYGMRNLGHQKYTKRKEIPSISEYRKNKINNIPPPEYNNFIVKKYFGIKLFEDIN